MKIHRIRITGSIFLEVITSGGLILRTCLIKGNLREFGDPLILNLFRPYIEGRGDPEVGFEDLLTDQIPGKVLEVYRTLKEKVPFGMRITYSDLGEVTGTHPRFVGYAMKVNPFPLIVPCHRVVGKRDIGGFSAGRDVKAELLRFEGLSPHSSQPHRPS
ncbi:MAG: MGMT family protein [Aquificota bacterium]|nr:MGMT family protein [Aquificota bacterium]MDQ7081883.1 MGMT family protein [Aquificota bacterium]